MIHDELPLEESAGGFGLWKFGFADREKTDPDMLPSPDQVYLLIREYRQTMLLKIKNTEASSDQGYGANTTPCISASPLSKCISNARLAGVVFSPILSTGFSPCYMHMHTR